MGERFNGVAAGPEFLAGLRIEGVESGVGGIFDALLGGIGGKTLLGERGRSTYRCHRQRRCHSGDDGRFGHIHIAGEPGWFENGLVVFLNHLESNNRAGGDWADEWCFEFRMYGTPDGREHPASAGGIFPGSHSAPHACAGEVHFFVTDLRGAEQSGAVVSAASDWPSSRYKRHSLLAGSQQFTAFVFEYVV